MIKHCLLAFTLLSTSVPFLAHAAIYKSIDAEGRITYSNMPSKGASKLEMDAPSAGTPGKTERAPSTRTPTPANFPRVDSQSQTRMDDKRKQILESELDTEQKALVDAKRAYADGVPKLDPSGKSDPNGKPNEALKKLQTDVDLHEENVRLLQKELRPFK